MGQSSSDSTVLLPIKVDAATGRILVSSTISGHNILSSTHSDTTAASVVRGDLMTGQGASPKWTRLAKGTANQVLSMDGTATDITWTTLSSGTVTSVSVVSANGLAGTVADATTTPAITLSTTVTGILEGNGTAISAASTTGTGAVVRASSPTLVSPVLGSATATAINGVTITASSGTLSITNTKTLSVSNTLTLAGTDSTTITFQGTDTYVGRTTTDTLTNKRITKRTQTITTSATPTPTGDSTDIFTITALAEAATIAAPTGTPTEGQSLIIRIKDNGTARALTWNAIYRAMGNALPTTTFISKLMYCGFIYNSTDARWDLIALANEA